MGGKSKFWVWEIRMKVVRVAFWYGICSDGVRTYWVGDCRLLSEINVARFCHLLIYL